VSLSETGQRSGPLMVKFGARFCLIKIILLSFLKNDTRREFSPEKNTPGNRKTGYTIFFKYYN